MNKPNNCVLQAHPNVQVFHIYPNTQFGLRVAIQSLRVALKKEKIGFTVINPGNVATKEVIMDIEAGRFLNQIPIPMSDIISTIEFILSMSSNVEVGDINLIQKMAKKVVKNGT